MGNTIRIEGYWETTTPSSSDIHWWNESYTLFCGSLCCFYSVRENTVDGVRTIIIKDKSCKCLGDESMVLRKTPESLEKDKEHNREIMENKRKFDNIMNKK